MHLLPGFQDIKTIRLKLMRVYDSISSSVNELWTAAAAIRPLNKNGQNWTSGHFAMTNHRIRIPWINVYASYWCCCQRYRITNQQCAKREAHPFAMDGMVWHFWGFKNGSAKSLRRLAVRDKFVVELSGKMVVSYITVDKMMPIFPLIRAKSVCLCVSVCEWVFSNLGV